MSDPVRNGVRYSALYCVRFMVFLALLMILSAYLLGSFYDAIGAPGEVPSDVLSIAAGMLPPLLPIPFLAFLAGCMVPGTGRRLASRLVLNAYLAVAIVIISGDIGFALEDVAMSADVTADEIGMTVDPAVIGALMLSIPACSALDAVVEHLSRREPGEDDRHGNR